MKRIELVQTPRQLGTFIDFPHDLYRNDPKYVPELFIAQRDLLSPKKHPFYEHAEIQLFLAYDNNQVTGRIAAILNKNHNHYNNVNEGFFGFFDCIDDVETAKSLFSSAEQWLRNKGVTGKIKGPVNPSTNETCGVLVDGFHSAPKVLMTYNAPYYDKLLQAYGFRKQIDVLAYLYTRENFDDTRLRRLQVYMAEKLKKKGITIRPVVMKNFKDEVPNIREVYNSAWDKNLGFAPMSDKEFDYMAKDLKMIMNPELCLVAEHEGKMVGFGAAIPNINEILIRINRGRLFPFGIVKLLTGIKKVKSLRIPLLGVVEGYRKLGIEIFFYMAFIEYFIKHPHIGEVEASWILEDNVMMNKAIIDIGATLDKTYRLYEKD
ncbi:hypothetical protein SAMN05421788_101862 [Filimonas lacunae]|uniref:N-acetyltransferase domain-containing protein n=1 Tax=Filimonas lacunae TaxID=477680 RepID=A0A173MP26_9BACT|nr:hypothetical protein [Filimonas lacunae]BAV09425.1 hypothetical protein FLA_5474 [Filimonas lacunae]SIS72924.1 hypothetical protein SAMN05421788_101862 [Filimonas lacunae]